MSSTLLTKVADVLDALAEENASLHAAKVAEERAKREKMLEPVLDKLSFLSGESEEVLKDKLASANVELLDMLSKVAGMDSISEMGGPSSVKTAGYPRTKTEAAVAADDNFARWCVS